MFTASFHSGLNHFRDWITSFLVRTRIRPNTLTVIGFLLNIPVAILIARGQLYPASAAFIVASIFDVLDGSLAKAGGRTTKFGGFLDSTLDRLSDMLLFGGVAVFFWTLHGDKVMVFVTLVTLAFSLMISYTRARAECEIPECQAGLAERPERILILIVACLLNSLAAGILVLFVLTSLTFLTRIVYTWYQANERTYPTAWKWALLDFERGSRPYDALMLLIIAILISGRFFLTLPVFR